MSANAELLNFIHKNAEMGRDSVDHILELCKEPAFCGVLREMREGYNRVCISSEALLTAGGKSPDGVSAIARTMSSMMLDFSTIGDRTSEKFASMLLEGVDMGISELEEKMRIYPSAKDEYMNLAHAFRDILFHHRSLLRNYA